MYDATPPSIEIPVQALERVVHDLLSVVRELEQCVEVAEANSGALAEPARRARGR